MSSIRSASSRTTMRTELSVALRRSRWSKSRPGVATMTSGRRASPASCGPIGSPPMRVTVRRPRAAPSIAKCSAICSARAGAGARTGRAEALDGRNREGGRLAGARLGAADEVLAFECDADGPRLDRRGRDVARARDGVEHGRAEVQLVERTDHLGSFTFLVGLDLRLLPGRYFEEHPGPPAGPGGSDRGRT